jgi:ABC-type dipeptide/oligopeptide/nickel transport system permease component
MGCGTPWIPTSDGDLEEGLTMAGYAARRLLMMLPVVFGISLVTFLLAYLLPADPARMYAGPNASVETVNSIRHQLGLDRPFHEQYLRYVWRALQGDFGYSYHFKMPVLDAVLSRVPYTLELIFGGILVELLVGIPIGSLSALRQYSWLDRISTLLALLFVSAPPFWLGLLGLYFLGFKVPIFPLGGAGSLHHLILPALCAGAGGAAWYARMMRSSTLDVVHADYVRTARAKGLRGRAVVSRHILRNAIMPIVTMTGMDIPWFLGGIVLIETVFAWPGVGKLAVDAIQNVDIPLISGTVVFAAIVVVISNLATDLTYGVIDPRIRYQ